MHGIGTVRDYSKRELLGAEYRFATLFFPGEELQISLPAATLNDAVRKPLTEAKARALLETMKEPSESLSKSWKVRSRGNQERLASGDPQKLIDVYRGLLEIQADRGSLNTSDRRQLSLATKLLTEELSVALSKPPEQVERLLEEIISDRAA